MVMLLSFRNYRQNNSVKESKLNTVSSDALPDNDEWMETDDDVVTVATNEDMTHQQRYEYRKNRTYSKHKPIKY